MHRFIPIYASWAGAKVAEIPVEHHARTMGKSKYGLSRTLKVIFDLMTIKFMASYQTKPIYVFGTFGLIAMALSFIAGLPCVFPEVCRRRFVYPDTVARHYCCHARYRCTVFVDGNAGGNAGAHLSRVASETDLCCA